MSDGPDLSVRLSDEALALIADRVAAILDARQAAEHPEPWIGVAEAAEYLHCKPQRIYALVHQRRLHPRRDGARLLFRRSELDAWLGAGVTRLRPSREAARDIRNGR